MARNDPQMNLRVPMELKEKIEKTALENGRTITAEAVYRLEQSFKINNLQSSLPEKTIHEITNIITNKMMKVIFELQDLGVNNEITKKAFSILEEENTSK